MIEKPVKSTKELDEEWWKYINKIILDNPGKTITQLREEGITIPSWPEFCLKNDSGIPYITQHKDFGKWSILITKAALNYQDKTIRQIVTDGHVPSWAEYLLSKKR